MDAMRLEMLNPLRNGFAASVGANERAAALAEFREALEKTADAADAWAKLMARYAKGSARWSATINCAIESGITPEQIRRRTSVVPSTLSRWLAGVVAPSRMLKPHLVEELTAMIQERVSRLRDLAQNSII